MPEIFDLTVDGAPAYAAGKLSLDPLTIRASELAGGVSSTVLLLETAAGRMVVKQSLGQLRVRQEWFCDRSRILQESAALRLLGPLLPPGAVPKVLLEDAGNLLYFMSAAPAAAETWKTKLLRGECDPAMAVAAGDTLAGIFRAGWESSELEKRYGDLTVFNQLRLQPYFGQCAERHPECAAFLQMLIDTYPERCSTLVHGDWSPKNMLVADSQFMAIDLEVIHFGDPAFDIAFLLNHLLLKAFRLPAMASDMRNLATLFWTSVREGFAPASDWEVQTIAYWAGLLLARVDGKSPVEYITEPELINDIRNFAKAMIRSRPATIEEVFDRQCL